MKMALSRITHHKKESGGEAFTMQICSLEIQTGRPGLKLCLYT